MKFAVSQTWKQSYPGAAAGILVMDDVINPAQSSALDARKVALEGELRARYADYDRAALRAIPTLQAYRAYYKRFRKSYHVQFQLESVAIKGKPIPHVAALVEAMFMAELENLLLTAGHDLDAVQPPVQLGIARGHEGYVRLNGQEQILKAGDMMISDVENVISSVIYGPDRRTRIRPGTTRVLFTVYAPPGIGEEAVVKHLQTIRDNVLLIAPDAIVEQLEAVGTE